VRGDHLHEFARSNDLRFLPEGGEIAGVARDQVVGACDVGAFDENVIAGISGDLKWTRGRYEFAAIGDELKELNSEAFADPEFGTREHGPIFKKNRCGDKKASRFGEGKDEDSALEAVGFESRGNDYVGVEDQAKREH
jgi:hypothetical protein